MIESGLTSRMTGTAAFRSTPAVRDALCCYSFCELWAAISTNKAFEGFRLPSITFPKFAASTPSIGSLA